MTWSACIQLACRLIALSSYRLIALEMVPVEKFPYESLRTSSCFSCSLSGRWRRRALVHRRHNQNRATGRRRLAQLKYGGVCLVPAGPVSRLFSDRFLRRRRSRISVTATNTRQGSRSASCLLVWSGGRWPRVRILEPRLRDRHGQFRRRWCHIHSDTADEHARSMFSVRSVRGHRDARRSSGNSRHLQQPDCWRFWRRLLFSDRWIAWASQDNFSVWLRHYNVWCKLAHKRTYRMIAITFLIHACDVWGSGNTLTQF